MAAPTRTPRSRWIEQGLRALAAGGPDAVRVELLARALGVTRGGFYWHFTDRSALLAEMLDTWERATTDEVVERLEREGGDASAKLRQLLALTSTSVLRTDLAVRHLLRRPGRCRGPQPALLLAADRQPLHRRRPRPAQPRGRAEPGPQTPRGPVACG